MADVVVLTRQRTGEVDAFAFEAPRPGGS